MKKNKICNKCFLELELNKENFYARKGSKDGYRNDCKKCILKDREGYRAENKEKIIRMHKKWRIENEDYIKEKGRKYYKENKEMIKKNVKSYYRRNIEKVMETKQLYLEKNKEQIAYKKKIYAQENKDKIYEWSLKRRSRKHFVKFEGAARNELLDRDDWTCKQCGIKVHDRNKGMWNDEFKAHIDHIIPISKGGDSTYENLQVLCRSCNLRKSDKTNLEIQRCGQINMIF